MCLLLELDFALVGLGSGLVTCDCFSVVGFSSRLGLWLYWTSTKCGCVDDKRLIIVTTAPMHLNVVFTAVELK